MADGRFRWIVLQKSPTRCRSANNGQDLNPKEHILESIFRIGARSLKSVLRSTAQNRFATQSVQSGNGVIILRAIFTPLPAALDARRQQQCVLHREGRHRAGALFREEPPEPSVAAGQRSCGTSFHRAGKNPTNAKLPPLVRNVSLSWW
jgi:hypothetical protein